MWRTSARAGSGLSELTTAFESSLAFWVVLLIALSRIPPTASVETDCRVVSGYTSGPVPDTCTVQLTLNDTESEIISSLKDKYRDFPLRCRLRKYIHTCMKTFSNNVRAPYLVR